MRNRSRDIDAQVDAIVEPAKAPKQEQQKEAAQKGMPKPGMFDRLKKLITRD